MKGWAPVIAYTLLTYTSLPFTRIWQQFFRDQLGSAFNLSMNFFILVVGVVMVTGMAKNATKTAFWASMFVIFLLLLLATRIEIPEERLHLIQYAILGYLVSRAVMTKGAPLPQFKIVFCIGALIGLGDELIQWVLPSRVFDWWDVGYNITGVVFGMAIFYLLK